MSVKKLAEERANAFRKELADLLEKHSANLNLDNIEDGVDFSFDINGILGYSDSYENSLIDFKGGEVYVDDIRRSVV